MEELFSLKDFRWQNRVIIINSDTDHSLSKQQQKLLLADEQGLKERHLLVFEIDQEKITDITNQKKYPIEQDFLNEFQMEVGIFEVLLIGKDGGVKLRRDSPVENADIFGLIDQMPMRQAEMRRQKR
jgi:hypothetical protein